MRSVHKAEAEFGGRLGRERIDPNSKAPQVTNAGNFGPVERYTGYCLTDEHGVKHVFAIEPDEGITAQLRRRIEELGNAPMSMFAALLSRYAIQHAAFDPSDRTLGTHAPVKGTPAFRRYEESLEPTGQHAKDGTEYYRVVDSRPAESARLMGLLPQRMTKRSPLFLKT